MTRSRGSVAWYVAQSLPPLVTGAAYFLVAVTLLYLTRGGNGIATLWPPSGILLGALLVVPPHQARWHLMAAAAASFGANLWTGNPAVVAGGFTIANVAEPAIAVWFLRVRAKANIGLSNPGDLLSFCVAAAVGTSAAATIATVFAPVREISFWFSWLATDLLGIFMVTPLLLIMGRSLQHRRFGDKAIIPPAHFAMFAAVALTSGVTFWQPAYPLFFLPMLAVLIAAYRIGPVGAAGGVLIIATVSSFELTIGLGPQSLLLLGEVERNLFMQFYLLTLFLAALPIATLLAARSQLVDELAEKVRLLQLSEGAARVGHWRVDTATREVTWSQEVFRIYGATHGQTPTIDASIEAFHIEDRALVAATIGEALRGRSGFALNARLVRPDGDVRQVVLRGEIDKKDDDSSPGVFGIMQDITEQVAIELQLKAARLHAESAAAQAMIIAETDQLTGIANRRRAASVLDEAVRTSGHSGLPMSVAMFDIDYFKRVNDNYGHQAGDEVLKRVVADAAGQLRSADTLGRFGGEEFIVVLPNATADNAMIVAERIRRAIEENQAYPPVTISIGVAEWAAGETTASLLRRSDQALYTAKRQGRNILRLAA